MKEREFYRERIIEMIKKIESSRVIVIIYDFIKPIYEKEKSGD